MNAKEAKQLAIENHGDADYNNAVSAILDSTRKGKFVACIDGHLAPYDQRRFQLLGYKVDLKYTVIYKRPFTAISWF